VCGDAHHPVKWHVATVEQMKKKTCLEPFVEQVDSVGGQPEGDDDDDAGD
jgi:hypothetical protein